MSIQAGETLQHYRLVERLGAGGMGEVWLAQDLRLGRDVAIKVLPRGFAADEVHRARFEREGKVISSLNHPNICTLFDIGLEGETHFLVMERIEGESLADRLGKGPLPIEQVLETGAQIAAALAAAHRANIVHRDLKPGNVMLTRSGAKLLDFGLAKSAGESAAAAPVERLTDAPTQHKPLTQEGTILGTFQHMAPEQLEGLEADVRTDIFALGTVLYEMATGRPAFEGATKTSLIAAIVSSQPPPIADRQPVTPAAFEHIVRKCMEKDPEDRWQSAGDVAAQLQWISTQLSQSGPAPEVATGRKSSPWRLLPWITTALLAVLCAVLAFVYLGRDAEPQPVYRASLAPPASTALIPFDELGLALSPDGRRLAFVANEADGGKSIWIRDLDTMTADRLPETRGAWYPFWSPDGLHLGFFADGSLKTMDLRGGSPRVLAEAPSGRGGSWSVNDEIIYSPSTRSGVHRVSAKGGTPEQVTAYDPEKETTNRWPHFLPDGNHFLYISRAVVGGRGEVGRLMLASLDSSDVRVLIEDSTNAAYVEPGYLIYGRSGDLMAQRFDASALKLVGEPIPLTANKASYWEPKNFIPFAAADSGTIVYLPESSRQSVLRWYDRGGRPLEVAGEPGFYSHPRLSPGGDRIAWVQGRPQSMRLDVWVHDIELARNHRLTLESGLYGLPAWSPDGHRLAFQCQPKRVHDICVKAVDEGGDAEILYESKNWTSSGNWREIGIVVSDQSPETSNDIWLVGLEDPENPRRLVGTAYDEQSPMLSPDGKWFAYVANPTGRMEVYLRETREGSQQWQISSEGGRSPRWSRNGNEIIYTSPDGNVMAVAIQTRPTFRAQPPQLLFSLPETPDYLTPLLGDVTADGERLLLNLPVEGRASVGFHAMFNWTSLLDE